MAELIESIEDGVATLTLNRPERMNAFSKEIMEGLIEALPPEDRRRPYRLTGLGATTLKTQLEGLEGFARTGLRRLEGSGTS